MSSLNNYFAGDCSHTQNPLKFYRHLMIQSTANNTSTLVFLQDEEKEEMESALYLHINN